MNWAHRNLGWAVLLLAGADSSLAREPAARVVVRIYNYAEVQADVLGRAQVEAARIFRQAGVEVEWNEIDLSGPPGKAPAASTDEPVFNLKLLSESMAARIPRPARMFGIALHIDVFLFVHRVRDLARDSGFPLPLVLGHIMAHELGHLLLGENSHSSAGLMSETLRPTEFELATRGRLLFAPEEARRMRSRLAAGSF